MAKIVEEPLRRVSRFDGLGASGAEAAVKERIAYALNVTFPEVAALRDEIQGRPPIMRPKVAPKRAPPVRDSDVRQERHGDCWFLAALSALSRTHPERVARMTERSGSNVTVHLFDKEGRPAPTRVRVVEGEPWFRTFERALDRHGLLECGAPLSLGFKMLTGCSSSSSFTQQLELSEIASLLLRGEGVPTTAATADDAERIAPSLKGDHAYDVLSASRTSEGAEVFVRDPAGGRLSVPLDLFATVFEQICVLSELRPIDSVPPPAPLEVTPAIIEDAHLTNWVDARRRGFATRA